MSPELSYLSKNSEKFRSFVNTYFYGSISSSAIFFILMFIADKIFVSKPVLSALLGMLGMFALVYYLVSHPLFYFRLKKSVREAWQEIGLCPECGYDWGHTPSPHCPECGNQKPPNP